MRGVLIIYQKYKWHLFFIIGLLVSVFSCAAYLIIGTQSYVQIHDQLDGEVLNYIYRAKYLFSGSDIIPEFMNGMHGSSMTPPAPLGVLFYKLLPTPFLAYAIMHVFILVVGYVGFFLLLKKLTNNPLISFVVACLFIYLPFYPVYGLSILGQPLLIWALWELWEDKAAKFVYYACIFLYAAGSSFVLVGYAWVGLFLAVLVVRIILRKNAKKISMAFAVLLGSYLVCNVQLVKTVLGINGATYSLHREEMVVSAMSDFIEYFFDILLNGVRYAEAYNGIIVIMALCVLVLIFLFRLFSGDKSYSATYRMLVFVFLFNVLVTFAACVWKIPWIVDFRTEQGGMLKHFQADRITWLLPVGWYVILALCLQVILVEWKKLKVLRVLAAFVPVVMLCITIYENSAIYHNLRLMIFPNTYQLMNWDDFYAEDVYEQIDDFIGKDKSTYRTLSLGITPAAALYNGFYCLDGYSNMYSLEYKHQFRKIIASELDKLDEIRTYFDCWGNRCYLLNSETGNYMLIDKENSSSYKELDLNTAQMYAMGARYLFSAMPIDNAKELGLELLRDTPFATEESYFEVWLYEVLNECEEEMQDAKVQ